MPYEDTIWCDALGFYVTAFKVRQLMLAKLTLNQRENVHMRFDDVRGFLQFGAASMVLLFTLTGCGGGGGGTPSTSPGPGPGNAGTTLVSITVTPSSKTLGVGATQQLSAAGNYLDPATSTYSTVDITSSVSWSSSSMGIATVNSAGLAAGVAAGTATITASLGGQSSTSALTVTNWTTRMIAPRSSVDLGGIAFDGTTYVTVKDTVSTSSNLVVWDEVDSTASSNDVLWNGSASSPLFVHGGFFGIYSSANGSSWTGRYGSTGSDEPAHFAYSSTLPMWVGIGYAGTIYRSVDGIAWTAAAAPTAASLNSIAWTGTQFVIVGAGTILTSPDGVNWTVRVSGTVNNFTAVGATSSLIVASTGAGGTTSGIYTSPDGITWTYAGASMTGASSIINAGGQWVAVGFNMAATSADGKIWTQSTVPAHLAKVIHDGARYVAVGADHMSNVSVFTSTNGAIWTTKTAYLDHISVARSPGSGLLVVATSSDRSLASSDNGVTWQYGGFTGASTTEIFQSVAWSPSLNAFIANTGLGGMSSTDGITWTPLGNTTCPGKIAASPTLLVNACRNYGILSPKGLRTSVNGATWTAVTYPSTQGVEDVFWTGSQYVALGDGGDIVTSPDAVTWTKQTSGTTQKLNGFAASPGSMVAVGMGGTIISSSDGGVTWTARTSGTTGILNRVVWTGTKFVAVGESGIVRTSIDGITWNNEPTPYSGMPFGGVPFNLNDIVQSGASLVMVGTKGLIATQP